MLIVKEFSWVYIYTFIYFFFVHIFISNLFTYYFHNITGTMTMELGGKVSIVCSKTGYSCELEFKLRVSCIFGGEIREGVRGLHQYYRFCLLKLSLWTMECVPKSQISQVFIYPSTQVPKYPSNQSPMYPSSQILKCPSSQIPKFPSSQVPKYPSTQSPMYPCLQSPKFPSSHVPKFLSSHIPKYPKGLLIILYMCSCTY